jgi:hypothetical protein
MALAIAAPTITVSQEARKLFESPRTGGVTHHVVTRGLIIADPTRLTMAELADGSERASAVPSRSSSRRAESSGTEGTGSFRLEGIEGADIEVLGTPPEAREGFIAAFR